jgi:hypothetical protein
MKRDVIGLDALDLILRALWAGVTGITFMFDVVDVDVDDRSADPSGLGTPTHAIADFEIFLHDLVHAEEKLESPDGDVSDEAVVKLSLIST